MLYYVHPRSWGPPPEAFLQGGARLWCPRRRLATAPGRLARPAPSGNDDPCVEQGRRTILEGLPDNGKHGPGPEIPRGAPKGERPVAGNARRLTARTHVGLARFAKKTSGLLARCAEIDRRPGSPVVRNDRKAVVAACVDRERRLHAGHGMPRRVPRTHPSAIGAPPTPRGGE